MGQSSSIEWTEASWNPIAGCTKVSAGCANCYAERMTWRLVNNPATAGVYEGTMMGDGGTDDIRRTIGKATDGGPRWSGQINLIEGRLTWPLHWRKPRMVFVCSMSDLFHPKVPFEFVDKVFATIGVARWHTYQVLTKRARRMAEYMNTPGRGGTVLSAAHEMALAGTFGKGLQALQQNVRILDLTRAPWPLPNVWMGVSVEDQEAADERILELVRLPVAMVRFVSAEPLLGPVDLRDGIDQLDWAIVGGESGPGARPMHPDWARSLRDQCQAAEAPFFFKQWGAWLPYDHDPESPMYGVEPDHYTDADADAGYSWRRVGKRRAGRLLDGREWSEFPVVSQHSLEASA